ncbi:MAG: acyltransferase [Candidatus Acidiferrales bacterium]
MAASVGRATRVGGTTSGKIPVLDYTFSTHLCLADGALDFLGRIAQSRKGSCERVNLTTSRGERMQRRIPQLDAVRGVAILVVMMHNISFKYSVFHSQQLFRNGWMGVDLFFVLSGLLITGILLDTKQSQGYFKNFYVRRCLRIWPLYYSLIFFMFVVVRFLNRSEFPNVLRTSSPWWAFPLFLQNFLLPVSTDAAGPLGVTWSLAIEEQFYLIWPLIVQFSSRNQLRRICIAVMCVSPVLRYYLSLRHVNLYVNVFCRLDGLMAGALIALLVRSDNFDPSKLLKRAWVLLVIAAPLAFVTEAFDARWIVFSFTALASASFVYVSWFSEQKWLHAVMTNRVLIYTGTISYGLYLLHKIPFGMVQAAHLDRRPYLPLPIILVASFALAALSWNLLEKPFLDLKRYFAASPDRASDKSARAAHGK